MTMKFLPFPNSDKVSTVEKSKQLECVRALNILLKVVPAKSILKHSKYFCEKHRDDENLLGVNAWDEGMVQFVRIELSFFIKHRAH